MIEVKNAEKLIKEFYPDFTFLKDNAYSIVLHEDMTRLTFERQANKKFRIKSAFKIPFVYIPLCFKYGYINVNRTIWEVYHRKWVVSDAYEQDKYDKIKGYIEEHGLNK